MIQREKTSIFHPKKSSTVMSDDILGALTLKSLMAKSFSTARYFPTAPGTRALSSSSRTWSSSREVSSTPRRRT